MIPSLLNLAPIVGSCVFASRKDRSESTGLPRETGRRLNSLLVEELAYRTETRRRLQILGEDPLDNRSSLRIGNELTVHLDVTETCHSKIAGLCSVFETTSHVPGEISNVGVLCFLLDEVDHSTRERIPVDRTGGYGLQRDPGISDRFEPIAELQRIVA
jgi:hypothetical protein